MCLELANFNLFFEDIKLKNCCNQIKLGVKIFIAIVTDVSDNVATVLDNIKNGDIIILHGAIKGELKAIDDIPKGHKVALFDIPKGEHVIKYGEIIGIAIKEIKKGQHVHIHNLDSLRGKPL
ncbi:MAG: UxaA family hydrolase [Caldisphaera sp.]